MIVAMTKDEHGIDIDEDTDMDTAEGPADETQEQVERDQHDAEQQRQEEANRGETEHDSEEREDRAREAENPDAHRDEEPFSSE